MAEQDDPPLDSASDDEDLAALDRMAAREAQTLSAPTPVAPRWGIDPADQPFVDELPPPPEYLGFGETRTAASTGMRGPLAVILAVAAAGHAIAPLAGLLARAGAAAPLRQLTDALSPGLWERLEPLRAGQPPEALVLGVLPAVFCITGLVLIGRRLRLAAQMLIGAAVLNAADWFLISDLRSPGVLTGAEMKGAIAIVVFEFVLIAIVWLRIRPPDGALSPLWDRRN